MATVTILLLNDIDARSIAALSERYTAETSPSTRLEPQFDLCIACGPLGLPPSSTSSTSSSSSLRDEGFLSTLITAIENITSRVIYIPSSATEPNSTTNKTVKRHPRLTPNSKNANRVRIPLLKKLGVVGLSQQRLAGQNSDSDSEPDSDDEDNFVGDALASELDEISEIVKTGDILAISMVRQGKTDSGNELHSTIAKAAAIKGAPFVLVGGEDNGRQDIKSIESVPIITPGSLRQTGSYVIVHLKSSRSGSGSSSSGGGVFYEISKSEKLKVEGF